MREAKRATRSRRRRRSVRPAPPGRGCPSGATLRAAAIAGVALWAFTGCGSDASGRRDAPRAGEVGYRGVVLPRPLEKPDFSLTDTRGEPYAFREETEGRLALLFFGYTHCPDICPVQVANLAAVLDDLPYRARERIRVIFVTTDPERDTAERLREWLDRFDPDFVGLRGELSEVNRIQERLNLPPAIREDRGEDGYLVGHASQVIAFTPEGETTVAYPSGTRQADWVHDLPRLLGDPDRPAGP